MMTGKAQKQKSDSRYNKSRLFNMDQQEEHDK